ncbi:Espin-like protein [Microtus ochrogaster]|uniref:Espin-like protein n=1 Tax=Microtus ochrogaster TaxID=79684 RepID=A0A8J6KT02_MICOH|nr:Espin-like protein [Microtus ochrogaster]
MEEQQALAASKDGDVAALERLLEAGALSPGITDELGAGLVHHATRAGHLDCVKFLVQRAKLPGNQQAHNGATPVHDAAATGNLAELCWLVRDGGCGLQDQDASGVSPLHLAARFGHPALVEWLLREGHTATLETLEGALPLHHAAVSGDLTCVKLLTAAHSSGVNQQTRNGASPLYLACQEGHLHLAQFLVKDCGADVSLRALDGMSSLHAAAARGHYSLVVWLVTFTDIGLTTRDKEGATALHLAARGGHTPILDRLLLMGAPITRDSWGGTPLHDAAENGHMECCQTLLSHRVDPFLRDEDGYTAMDLADYHGHQDCAQYLREMSRPVPPVLMTPPPPPFPPPPLLTERISMEDGRRGDSGLSSPPCECWSQKNWSGQGVEGDRTQDQSQSRSSGPTPAEQATWRYSQTHQAILGPFGELLTEDDLVYLEKQINDLQLRRRCQEYESELSRLAAQLQALLPEPLVSITVNSHFLPRAPGLEDEEVQVLAPELEASAELRKVEASGQPLPFWCSHIGRLVRSMSLLLKGMNGLTQGEEKPPVPVPQDPGKDAITGPPRSEVQREIQECGVSVRTLRGNFESAPDLPYASNSGPCEMGGRPGQCLRGCWSAPPQPRGDPMGGEPRLGDTEEASDSGISCEEAPSEAGAGPGLDLASLRKERIVMLFLGHWKKSAYTPALRTAACRTLEAQRARSRGKEATGSSGSPSPPPSDGPRLGHLWQQRGIITHLLGTWKAIMAHVPARQLRRLSRRARGPLSPEQFLPHVDGAPVPYNSLSLDLFMLGYFQLLECDLPAEERKMRHLLCFEVFENLGAHGWEAVRAFHKAVTDEVAAGRRAWTDGFEDIKARFFGSSQGPAWDMEPGRKLGLTPLESLPHAALPGSSPEPVIPRLGSDSQRGSFNSGDICGYIDRSFAFWKEKEAEMFNFGE